MGWIFPRYEYFRYGNRAPRDWGMCDLWRLHIYVTVFTRIVWNETTVPVKSPHTKWQHFAVCKPIQTHFDGMCIHTYSTCLLTNELYPNTFYAWKISLKYRDCRFCYTQGWRHRLRHSIVRNMSTNAVLTSQLLECNSQKGSSTFKPYLKFHGQQDKMWVFVKFAIFVSRSSQCPRDANKMHSSCISMRLW